MNNAMSILLVEDDDVAAESVVRCLQKTSVNFSLVLARDGLEALTILRAEHPHLTIEKPYLILLDLNMPRMNGFEFLQEIRADVVLREAVIFVLTTSDADADRARAYHKNIAGYLVKASVGPKFSKLITLLDDYANIVRLPD